MAFYLALKHPTSYNPPVAHLLTSQSRIGVADDILGPMKCMDCLHDGLKNLRKIWECHLISTLHAIELVLNEYVLTSKDHGRNVFWAFRFGLTVNTFKFMINHEFETFISGMSGMIESNFMSRTAAQILIVCCKANSEKI